MDCCADRTRPSRIPPLAPEVVERVVEMTLKEPPGEAAHWNSRTMAAASGVSGTSVRRIWRAHGLPLVSAPHVFARSLIAVWRCLTLSGQELLMISPPVPVRQSV